MIIGAIRGITLDWLIAPGSFDLDAAYEQQWEMLVGWLAPGGSVTGSKSTVT